MEVGQVSEDDKVVTQALEVKETLDNMLSARRDWLKETDEHMEKMETLIMRHEEEREQYSEKMDNLKRLQDAEYKDYSKKYDSVTWKIDMELTLRFIRLFELQCKRDEVYEEHFEEMNTLKSKQKEDLESYMKQFYADEMKSDIGFEDYGRELFKVKGRRKAEREYNLKALVTLKRKQNADDKQDEPKPFELGVEADSERYSKGLLELKSKRVGKREEFLKSLDLLKCKQQDEYQKLIEGFHTRQGEVDEDFIRFLNDSYEMKRKWDSELESFLKGMVILNEKHATEVFQGLKELDTTQARQMEELENFNTEWKKMGHKSVAMQKQGWKKIFIIKNHLLSPPALAVNKLAQQSLVDVPKPTSLESAVELLNKVCPDFEDKTNLSDNYELGSRTELEVDVRENVVKAEEMDNKKKENEQEEKKEVSLNLTSA